IKSIEQTNSNLSLSFYTSEEAISQEIERSKNGVVSIGLKGNTKEIIYAIPKITKEVEREAIEIKQKLIENYEKNFINYTGDWKDRLREAKQKYMLNETEITPSNFPLYLSIHDTYGLGPLSIILENKDNIEEIMLNKPLSNLFVYHSKIGYCKTNMHFKNEEILRFMFNKMIDDTGKEMTEQESIIEAQLFDGSRVHAQSYPFAPDGFVMSIRLKNNMLTIKDLIEEKVVDLEAIAYLWLALDAGVNILIVGAPAAGKTTFLKAISELIPNYRRIISIETEANEIKFSENYLNAINLKASTKGTSLVKETINALHMRPDQLIIGEIIGPEAKQVFSSGNYGIPFIATMHSNEGGDMLLHRLMAKPMEVELDSLHALNIAVFLDKEGKERKVKKICEYRWPTLGDEGTLSNNIAQCLIKTIYYNDKLDLLSLKGSPTIAKYAEKKAISLTDSLVDLKNRIKFLKKILDNSTQNEIITQIQEYGD
ncbi:MAG: ATPase, T2SS/T4P/T4SS family, partial [Candidatus Micrarchaeaceae archaeon]